MTLDDDLMEAVKNIRRAAEILEKHSLDRVDDHTRACVHLASHHLIDAVVLLLKGRVSPESIIWAKGVIDKIEQE